MKAVTQKRRRGEKRRPDEFRGENQNCSGREWRDARGPEATFLWLMNDLIVEPPRAADITASRHAAAAPPILYAVSLSFLTILRFVRYYFQLISVCRGLCR